MTIYILHNNYIWIVCSRTAIQSIQDQVWIFTQMVLATDPSRSRWYKEAGMNVQPSIPREAVLRGPEWRCLRHAVSLHSPSSTQGLIMFCLNTQDRFLQSNFYIFKDKYSLQYKTILSPLLQKFLGGKYEVFCLKNYFLYFILFSSSLQKQQI